MFATEFHPGCSLTRRVLFRLLHLALILAFVLGAIFPGGVIPARAAALKYAAQPTVEPTPVETLPSTIETSTAEPPSITPTGTLEASATPPLETRSTPTATATAETLTPTPQASPSATPTATATPQPASPTPESTAIPTATPEPATSTTPVEAIPSPLPTETALPVVSVTPTAASPTPAETGGYTLALTSDPPEALPGGTFLLSWQIGPEPLPAKGLVLSMTFPPGVAPLDNPSDTAVTETGAAPLSLPVSGPTGALSCRVDPGARGPFTIQANLLLDGKLLVETKLVLPEGGLTRISSTGGEVEGLGGMVAVSFPQDAASADLEVRIRRPLPETLPPTTLSGSPFEIVAVNADSKTGVTHFEQPLTITVQYDPARYPGQENALALSYYDPASQSWLSLPSQVDLETHTIRAQSDHLTVFDYDLKTWQAAHPPSLSGFQVSGYTGSANYSVPLELPPGPGGFQPALSLSYDSQMIDSVVAP